MVNRCCTTTETHNTINVFPSLLMSVCAVERKKGRKAGNERKEGREGGKEGEGYTGSGYTISQGKKKGTREGTKEERNK